MKQRKFSSGGQMEDVSPEDVAEMKKMERAGKAYNQAMPEADTTFGRIAKGAKMAAAASPTLSPIAEAGMAATVAAKKLLREGKKRNRNEGETTNAMGDSYKKGGMTASKRADGIAQRGKTRGTMVMCGGGMAKRK